MFNMVVEYIIACCNMNTSTSLGHIANDYCVGVFCWVHAQHFVGGINLVSVQHRLFERSVHDGNNCSVIMVLIKPK